MAAIDPAVQAIINELANALRGTSLSLTGFQRDLNNAARNTDAAARRIAASQAIGTQLEYLQERFSETGRRTGTLADDFEKLRRATLMLEQGTDRSQKLMQLNSIQLRAATITMKDFFKDTVGNQLKESVKGFIKTLQTSLDPLAVATNVTQAVSQFVSGIAKGGGQFLQNIAGVASTGLRVLTARLGPMGAKIAGPLSRIAGSLTSVLGKAIEGIGGLGDFIFEVLATELDKTSKAFVAVTSSGALFADGMTGMRKAAGDAELPLNIFASVVQKNADALSNTGLGVTQGAERMGAAIKAGGDDMKLKLFKLGFSFEEQAGLVAEVMADMRQAGEAQLLPADVAKQTERYAENLRVLTAITGEDGKKRMEAARQATTQLAFQAKLAEMGEKERHEAQMAMANMSDIQRKNFMDQILFGSVINKEGAAAAALSPALSDSVSEFVDKFNNKLLTPEVVRDINYSFGEKIKAQALELGPTIGAAAVGGVGGIVGSLADLFSKEVQERMKMSPTAIADAEKSAKHLKETADKLTEETGKAAKAAQALQVGLEKLLTPVTTLYANMTRFLTEAMVPEEGSTVDQILERLFGVTKTRSTPAETPEQKEARLTAAALEEIRKTGKDYSAMSQEAFNEMVESQKARLAAFEERSAAFQRGRRTGTPTEPPEAGIPGASLGGILSGPRTGYRALLHGVEAVVPLPSGKEIPVEVKNMPASTGGINFTPLIEAIDKQSSAFDQLVETNAEMLRVMQQNRDATRELRDNIA